MPEKTANLRNLVITTSSGTDVKDTQQLKGEATPNAAFKATNETKEYTTGGGLGKGKLGGKNAGL